MSEEGKGWHHLGDRFCIPEGTSTKGSARAEHEEMVGVRLLNKKEA